MKTSLSLLAISSAGILSASAALTYIDAPSVGTTVGDITFTGTAGGWTQRTNGPAANAFNTTAQQGTGANGAVVTATMSIANLTPSSTYTNVRLYYIGKSQTDAANNWDFNYAYNAVTGSVRDEIDGTIVDLSSGGIGAPASTTGDIRYMINVADFATDGSGGITFNFDRPVLNRSGVEHNARFVIDGIGFDTTPIPEPSSTTALLAAVSGLFLLRRKR